MNPGHYPRRLRQENYDTVCILWMFVSTTVSIRQLYYHYCPTYNNIAIAIVLANHPCQHAPCTDIWSLPDIGVGTSSSAAWSLVDPLLE